MVLQTAITVQSEGSFLLYLFKGSEAGRVTGKIFCSSVHVKESSINSFLLHTMAVTYAIIWEVLLFNSLNSLTMNK